MTGGVGGGGGGGGGGVVHPAIANATAPSETSKLLRIEDIRTNMWILMVEAGIALFLLVFIVWWTMYADKKPADQQQETLAAPEKKDPPELPPA